MNINEIFNLEKTIGFAIVEIERDWVREPVLYVPRGGSFESAEYWASNDLVEWHQVEKAEQEKFRFGAMRVISHRTLGI